MSTEQSNASTDGRLRAVLGRPRRVVAAILGGALVVSGLTRRSLGGSAAAALGGWLLYRGLCGGDSSKQAFAAEDETPAGVERSHTVTVREPADDLYDRWRDPETVAQLFGGFAAVSAPAETPRRRHAGLNSSRNTSSVARSAPMTTGPKKMPMNPMT